MPSTETTERPFDIIVWGASGFTGRIVVDYRRVNARTLRAVYYVRRADDVKAEAAGSASEAAGTTS